MSRSREAWGAQSGNPASTWSEPSRGGGSVPGGSAPRLPGIGPGGKAGGSGRPQSSREGFGGDAGGDIYVPLREKTFDSSSRVGGRTIPRYDAAADRLCPLSRSDTFQRRVASMASAEKAERATRRAEAEKRRRRFAGTLGELLLLVVVGGWWW